MKGKCMKWTTALLTVLVIVLGSSWAFGGPGGEGRKSPPSEAIEVCKDKAEETAVEFTTPRGDKVKATCRMMALPEDFAGNDGRKGPKGPPAEAIEVCKDKAEGTVVEFTTPRGDKVKATCRMMALPEDFVR